MQFANQAATFAYAEFLHRIGAVRTTGWKDYFFDDIFNEAGS